MAKSDAADGALRDGVVVVADAVQANRLHSKGAVGRLSGQRLELDLAEAAWLVAQGKLQVRDGVRGADLPDLLRGEAGHRVEVDYLAYRDLRERGLAAQPRGHGTFAVWTRGQSAPKKPSMTVAACAERDPVLVGQLQEWAEAEAVVAVVDEDGDLTHYRVTSATPEGSVRERAMAKASGLVLEDRVLVTDARAAAEWREKEFVGTPHGDGLLLSFTEAEALRQRGLLDVAKTLARTARERQAHFSRTLPVYQTLRSAGVVARSGFKFGTHLRGYRGDPDSGHAQWLFQCCDAGDELHWSELSRAIRLAHGVRKSFCVAVVGEPVRFVHLAWHRL